MTKKRIKTGSDFSGVGAFDQALSRLGVDQDKKFACDMDKHARQTYVLNYGEPEYYPENVYDREIPEEPLDIYMTSPPCQAFSLAGKRKGKDDHRGILFFNSLEFIEKNKPRYFIFENVKGLISHDKKNPTAAHGQTFSEWLNYLGGKSVNGNETIFPYSESVPYHIYYKVMNAKHYGVPQNRERIFIIGIRDDADNHFHFPKKHPLEKKLKDVLEDNVPEKYFLSEKMLEGFLKHADRHNEKGTGFAFSPSELSREARAITTNAGSRNTDNFVDLNQVGTLYESNSDAGRVYDPEGISCTIKAEGGGAGAKTGLYIIDEEIQNGALRGRNNTDGKIEQHLELINDNVSNTIRTVDKDNVILIPKENGGFEKAKHGDGVNYKKAEGFGSRVLDQVSGALDTDCKMGVALLVKSNTNKEDFIVGHTTNERVHGWHENENIIGAHRGDEKRSSVSEHIYHKESGVCTTIQTAHTPKLIVEQLNTSKESHGQQPYKQNRIYSTEGISPALDTEAGRPGYLKNKRIRRLTPRECFRLMDFSEDFKWDVSDSQAYKQAGNSIVVQCLVEIIKRLKF